MTTERISVLPENRRVERVEPEHEHEPEHESVGRKKKRRKGPRKPAAWLQRLSLMTGVIVVISASVAVAWGLRRYLRTSPRFSVRHVQVDGNDRRTDGQIAKRGGIDLGRNIFTVEEDRTKAAIEADPWIETADVRVELPSAVNIVVTEREARAVATFDGRLYLVDTKGNIFKEVVENDPQDLPVVTGIDPERIARDRESVTSRIRRALELVADLEQAKVAKRYPVQEVHLEPDGAVSVTIGTDGILLQFGRPPYRTKVDKAERILEELRYRKVKRAVVFLDNKAHPERVVVRLQTTQKAE